MSNSRIGLWRVCICVTVVAAATVLSACARGGNPEVSVPPSLAAGASAGPSASSAATAPPTIVGVTTEGALVTLNPTTGVVEQTLVPSGVIGDEAVGGAISVAPSGMVFFIVHNGCGSTIEEVPVGGGTAAVIAPGAAPAVSPDGTKLAYVSQPQYNPDCQPASPDPDEWSQLEIRTLSSGATATLPAVPAAQDTGLPHPISHLSWSADNTHLAVSIAPAEDNDGYQVNLVDTAHAQYFVAGAGVVTVPVTGSPDPSGTVLGEADYLPNGDLFVSRFCCQGTPGRSLFSQMWEVRTSGTLVHQVAIGNPDFGHSSLDISSDGQWLLYVAHTVDAATLYVSQGGATPRTLTTGIFAAAWS
jgi:hypothetical protein